VVSSFHSPIPFSTGHLLFRLPLTFFSGFSDLFTSLEFLFMLPPARHLLRPLFSRSRPLGTEIFLLSFASSSDQRFGHILCIAGQWMTPYVGHPLGPILPDTVFQIFPFRLASKYLRTTWKSFVLSPPRFPAASTTIFSCSETSPLQCLIERFFVSYFPSLCFGIHQSPFLTLID